MQHNLKIPLLRAMGHIFEISAESQLSDNLWTELQQELQLVSDYFDVSTIQAFLVAHIFVLNYNQNTPTINRITRHLNCNPMRLLEYSSELEDLVQRRIIRREGGRRHQTPSLGNNELILSPRIEEALLQDKPMPKPASPEVDCFVKLLERVAEMENDLSENEISPTSFEKSIHELLKRNIQFAVVEQIQKLRMDSLDAFVFLKLAWEILNGMQSLEVESAVKGILCRNTSRRVKYLQGYLKETNVLQTLGWVNLKKSRFLNEAEIELAEGGRKMLSGMGFHLDQKQEKNKKYLDPKDIAFKKLFFNARETKELEMLQSMLMEKNFNRLQSRMKKKNLPRGLTAIFFGYPGTGKTESVLQMARKSGREIYKADISQTKSMWFGESEKIIKRIFTDYRIYAADCKRMPILLFNEADAIIAKRKDSASSTVAQTENAIQNIILEELEIFEGIFMATTNLMSNLDKAFERRFLFKVEFDKPAQEIKAKIWKSKLPFLSNHQCLEVAHEFDFTGGQIDNIVRKCETHDVLTGNMPAWEQIDEFCRSESMQHSNTSLLGFRQAGQGDNKYNKQGGRQAEK
jgi:hypothetical protein